MYMIFFVLLFDLCCYIMYIFFFFKQKTAYEMRISDWSSDVCSSDLAAFPTAGSTCPTCSPARGRGCETARIPGGRGGAFRMLPHPAEIGRASCRERVCQYV